MKVLPFLYVFDQYQLSQQHKKMWKAVGHHQAYTWHGHWFFYPLCPTQPFSRAPDVILYQSLYSCKQKLEEETCNESWKHLIAYKAFVTFKGSGTFFWNISNPEFQGILFTSWTARTLCHLLTYHSLSLFLLPLAWAWSTTLCDRCLASALNTALFWMAPSL